MKILDGKIAAGILKQNVATEVQELIALGIKPCLSIIWDDNNQANNTYVRQKIKICDELGIVTKLITLKQISTQELLLKQIHELNNDKKVHGILVQLPLTSNINEQKVLSSVSDKKDVDCFNLINIGFLWTNKKNDAEYIKPCTPAGIIELLKINKISIEGKNVVIVNRSNIVGKPLAALFLLENATVTVCHSKTMNLRQLCKNADILICGIGKQNFFNKDFIKNDAVVIDVSINRNDLGKLCGDVDVDSLKNFNGWLSPVPGGVGPMTVIMVIKNLIHLTKANN